MRVLFLTLVLIGAFLAPDPAAARLSLLGIKNSLVQFALSQINVPGSLEITVDRVEEVSDGATDLVDLTVADANGVWLRIDRVSMSWVPSRVLSGELAITKLEANGVHVLRAPVPGPDEPKAASDDGPVEIKWPRAPLTVSAEGLRLKDVRIAPGVLGQNALAFDAEAALRDEGDEQSATFALRRTDEVEGVIRLDYRRDFAADTLRLSLDANEAAGGLVASLAGLPPGSAAEVKLSGDGPVLDWHGDLVAEIGNLGRLDGKIAVPSVQPAQVRLDVRASAVGDLRAAAVPLLDQPVDLKLDVLADPDGLVTLHMLEVRGVLGSVAAKGTFDTNANEVDLAVDLYLPSVGEPLLQGAEVSGVEFQGTVAGLIDALQAKGRLQVAEVKSDAAEASGLSLDADVSLSEGAVAFAVAGRAGRLILDKLEMTDGAPVTLNLAGVLEGEKLALTKGQVTAPLLTASVSGSADFGAGIVDLAYQAETADLTPVAAAYDTNARGTLSADGRVYGDLSGPVLQGSAALTGFELDGQAYGDVRLQHDIVLAEALSGTAEVRADTKPYGSVNVGTAFRLDGDLLTVSKLQASGLGVQASGRGPLSIDLSNSLIDGLLQWRAAKLDGIGRVAGVALAGSGNGTLKLHAPGGKQAVDVRAELTQFRTDGVSAESIRLDAAVRDALGEVPGLNASFRVEKLAAGGLELPEARAEANGTLKALDVTAAVSGTAPDGKPLAADFAARLGLDGPAQTGRVSRLEARYRGETIRLEKPLLLTVNGSSIRAKGLSLQVPGGRVSGDARLNGNRLQGDIEAAIADMSRLAKLADVPIQAGGLNLLAEFDTRRSASITMKATGVRSDELPPEAGGLDADVSVNWNGKEATADASIAGGFGDPVSVTATVALRPSSGMFPVPKPSAPLRGTVKWAGQIDTLWALVPAPDHYVEGRADVDLTISGTVAEPLVAGKAELTGGRYENLETGTILADLTATSEVAADGSFVVMVAGNDGAASPVNARIAIANGKLDAAVKTQSAILVRRPDLEATVTADITATGPLLGPTLAGEVLVDRAEVRLVHAVPPNIATLGDVRIKGEPVPRDKPAKDSKIQLNLRVHGPRNIFVRGRGLDSEWQMDLAVGGNSARPRVTGSIEKLRGNLVLVGKPFDLDTGRIFFSGATPVDPGINVRLLRSNDGIRGGIDVSGRASNLEITFVSTPTLPQGEVMPRVLYGRSRQSLSALEALELAGGIATLMDGSGGTLDQVRGAIGLDVLRVEDKGDGASVTVGKNLQDGVFVGANQPIDGGAASVRVEIEVFDNFAVETDLGNEGGSSVGVKWKRDF